MLQTALHHLGDALSDCCDIEADNCAFDENMFDIDHEIVRGGD